MKIRRRDRRQTGPAATELIWRINDAGRSQEYINDTEQGGQLFVSDVWKKVGCTLELVINPHTSEFLWVPNGDDIAI